MPVRTWLYGIAAASCLGIAPAAAQQTDTSTAMDAMTKLWMAAATPGEHHRLLNPLVGTWETTSTMWPDGPGKPPVIGKGKAEVKWILGGRFIQQNASGDLMGMPFSGIGMTGYDNLSKTYVAVWMDNSATGLSFSRGTMDSAGRVLTMYGPVDDPVTGERGKMAKYVTRIVDNDTIVFELHDLTQPEGMTKMGELRYTRSTH